MTKWEYAAIVRSGHVNIHPDPNNSRTNVERWVLVQPGKENHWIQTSVAEREEEGISYKLIHHPWQNPAKVAEANEYSEEYAKHPRIRSLSVNDANPKILFESTDILHLVNLAGAEGWEITGGLGLADNYHGHPETKWRMMRREL